jgi:hypothetical protein
MQMAAAACASNSYWGHHMVTLSLLQIFFPYFFQKLPIIKHIDFVKINIVMLVNTTLMWQGPRVGKRCFKLLLHLSYLSSAFACRSVVDITTG